MNAHNSDRPLLTFEGLLVRLDPNRVYYSFGNRYAFKAYYEGGSLNLSVYDDLKKGGRKGRLVSRAEVELVMSSYNSTGFFVFDSPGDVVFREYFISLLLDSLSWRDFGDILIKRRFLDDEISKISSSLSEVQVKLDKVSQRASDSFDEVKRTLDRFVLELGERFSDAKLKLDSSYRGDVELLRGGLKSLNSELSLPVNSEVSVVNSLVNDLRSYAHKESAEVRRVVQLSRDELNSLSEEVGSLRISVGDSVDSVRTSLNDSVGRFEKEIPAAVESKKLEIVHALDEWKGEAESKIQRILGALSEDALTKYFKKAEFWRKVYARVYLFFVGAVVAVELLAVGYFVKDYFDRRVVYDAKVASLVSSDDGKAVERLDVIERARVRTEVEMTAVRLTVILSLIGLIVFLNSRERRNANLAERYGRIVIILQTFSAYIGEMKGSPEEAKIRAALAKELFSLGDLIDTKDVERLLSLAGKVSSTMRQ